MRIQSVVHILLNDKTFPRIGVTAALQWNIDFILNVI